MIKRFQFFLPIALFVVISLPLVASAQQPWGGLVVCGNNSGGATGPSSQPCTFEDIIKQVQVVINFALFKIAAPLAAVMFAYAGFLYVTNRGDEGQIKLAHEIFWNVFLGLVIALAAWLIMNFILTFFLGEGSAFNFLK